MEDAVVSGVAHDTSEVKLTVQQVPDRPGVAAALFAPLADAGVNVDMIVQNVSQDGHTDISFTVDKELSGEAMAIAKEASVALEAGAVDLDEAVAKVSVIGAGMRSYPGIASKMFAVLAAAGINIDMISTSPIRVSCIIDSERVTEAVALLHQAFDPPFQPEEESR